MKLTILHGDNRERLGEFPDNHFSTCVCDPPYELGFMGKEWDRSGIAYDVEMWRQVFRVMKPGAHLLAFGGSRTYHRLACAIEDAGFIIRDQIMWLFGSGFPKNLDVSKALDKAAGAEREVVGFDADAIAKQNKRPTNATQCTKSSPEIVGIVTAPASPLARQWDGWGTALKPAHEPIVVARKPLEGSVIQNVLKWGCGGLNIHGCMIDTMPPWERKGLSDDLRGGAFKANNGARIDLGPKTSHPNGRWPANVIHDGSDEVLAEFAKAGPVGSYSDNPGRKSGEIFGAWGEKGRCQEKGRYGSAARFFYAAKASPAERNLGCEGLKKSVELIGAAGHNLNPMTGKPVVDIPRRNHHPTVKPIALMAYLVRLVTPPGGVVLDPFMGSGSTLIAAAKEGFDAVGIDQEAAYCELAEARCRGHLGMLAEIETENGKRQTENGLL